MLTHFSRWLVALSIASRRLALADSPWMQFRGPGGTGVADAERPPLELGPEKNVRWKTAVPSGLSSPIVVGDKLVLTAFDDGKLYTIAYNRADGSEAWRGQRACQSTRAVPQDRGQPRRVDPGERRRADCFVLRFVRLVLL